MERDNKKILILWNSFLLGDKEAFAFLYNQHVDILFSYGSKISNSRELVMDSIQEVFLDLYLKREKNKTNPENLKFYLILALKRNIIKKLKKNRKLVHNTEVDIDYLFEPEYSIEKSIIEKETGDEINSRITKALLNLPGKQKEALYLRFNQSLEYTEIANILNISVESVRKQVYRALKTIRESVKSKAVVFFIMKSPDGNK